MHSPVSTQAFAQLRAASLPWPERRISMMPSITARGSALTPPGPVTGHTSTHLPQRVQASAIASTRAERADSKVMVMGPDYAFGTPYGTPPASGCVSPTLAGRTTVTVHAASAATLADT